MRHRSFSRRLLALLLLPAMILAIFSGCASQPQSDPTQTTAATTAPVETTLPQRTENLPQVLDLSQRLTENQRLEPVSSRAPTAPQTKRNTVMVYMVGSDLESSYGAASADILEMLDAGLDPEYTNLVVYTGGARSWDLNISSSYNSVLALDATGQSLNIVATTAQAVNMGDPATLADFLWYAYENFPADTYNLILWDHGGGPLFGFGSDELFDYDGLYLWELDEALVSSPFADIDLGYIGFDACLMASIEAAIILAPYARYMIASEEVEDGNGWDYSFLSVYNDVVVPLQVARAILSSYESSMQRLRWKPEYTLSCMNLSYVSSAEYSLGKLFGAMADKSAAGGYNDLAKWRDQTKRFAMGSVSSLSNSYDLVDLGHMAKMLGNEYAGEVRSLLDSLDKLVCEQVSNVADTNGVSIYYPYDNKDLYINGGGDLARYYMESEGYRRFLDTFGTQWSTGRTDGYWSGNRTTQEPDKSGDYIYLQIEKEALETLSTATYSVLRYEEGLDAYYEVLMDIRIQPDENGLVAIPKDPTVFLLTTDTLELQNGLGQGLLWPAAQVSVSGSVESYVSDRAVLMTSTTAILGETIPVQMVFNLDTAANEAQILHILNRNENADFYGKMDVDISKYSMVGFYWPALFPTYGTDGSILPSARWQEDTAFLISYQHYRDAIHLEPVHVSDIDGAFYCQLNLKDTYGNTIASDLVQLKEDEAEELFYIPTDVGDVYYAVTGDHAEVVGVDDSSYDPAADTSGGKLVIAEHINGIPVTVIRQRAFARCRNLTSVVIPGSVTNIDHNAFAACYNLKNVQLSEGVQRIGIGAFSNTGLTDITLPQSLQVLDTQAFAGSGLTRIQLPSGLAYIGDGVFGQCTSLTAIEVADGNSRYRSIDGVLFSADSTRLIAFPGAYGTSYQVPQGTVEISVEAFKGNTMLTDISFPETLEVIGSQAFCNVLQLQDIRLPDSLTRIGPAAFGVEIGFTPTDNVKTIAIGPNVSWIGIAAFEGYRMDEFTVDPANPYYSAKNGCLLNSAGTRLIRVPYNFQGVLQIPDGVGYIDTESLSGCSGITELILPDSVGSISRSAGVPEHLQKLTVGSGMCNWNGLHHFIGVPQIELSEENPFYELTDGCIYNEEGTVLLACLTTSGEVTIPEGITTMDANAFGADGALGITKVQLPASLIQIVGNPFGTLRELQAITVASGNPGYAAHDGLLYTADGKTLVACPLGITGTVTVRQGTVEIGADAFTAGYRLQAEEVILPEGVKTVRSGNFSGSNYYVTLKLHLPASLTDIYPGMLEYVAPGDMEIYAPADSYAEAYAVSLGLTVIH